jgi:tetratricopeptide (TPR) repeat protein
MTNRKANKNTPGRPPSRGELRASIVWPVVIAVGIWLAGLIIYIVAPGRFDALVSAIIAVGLAVYLFWFQRSLKLTPGERVVMLLLALPAILGLTFGVIRGQAVYAITGVCLSLLLLAAQRALTVPLSYRMARRSFSRGHLETALDLVDKAIAARPGFWESYQLRALIYLSGMQFGAAERDALKALELRPDAHPALNTLGQIHFVNRDYARAADSYARAVALSPKQALYHYHHGLALYRLGQARDAAEPLAASTRLGLPDVAYELQAYYYLGRALEQNGEIEKAEEVFADMVKFKDGVELLKADLKAQPDFPELPVLRADLRDIEKRLAAARQTQT